MTRSTEWLEHVLHQTRWRPQRQVVALGTLGFFIALIMGALYLSQVVSEATTYRRLEDLLAQRDELERRNELLRADIAESRAVPQLQAEAERLGFQVAQPGQIEYLPVRGYNPPSVDTVAPLAVSEDEEAVYDETFTGWLSQQWDAFMRSVDQFLGGG